MKGLRAYAGEYGRENTKNSGHVPLAQWYDAKKLLEAWRCQHAECTTGNEGELLQPIILMGSVAQVVES